MTAGAHGGGYLGKELLKFKQRYLHNYMIIFVLLLIVEIIRLFLHIMQDICSYIVLFH
jgi:hypothetical protein